MPKTVDIIKHLEVVEGLLKLASMREDKIIELTRENEELKQTVAMLQRESGYENGLCK